MSKKTDVLFLIFIKLSFSTSDSLLHTKILVLKRSVKTTNTNLNTYFTNNLNKNVAKALSNLFMFELYLKV